MTRNKPHVDGCASSWLIKRFIDKYAVFGFITKEQEIPKSAIGFTLAKAEINPVEGVKTTFDSLVEKYRAEDPVVLKIREIIRDYEFNEENPERIRLKETLGLCFALKGLEKTSKDDAEATTKAIMVMDAFYVTLKDLVTLNLLPSPRMSLTICLYSY